MFVWKSSLVERDPQVVRKNMLVAGRVFRQACSFTILTTDRDYPPDCTHLSKWRPATGQASRRTAVSSAVPRAVLDFTWAVYHQRLGGEGQVRSVRERGCFGAFLLGHSPGALGDDDELNINPPTPWQ